MAYMKDPMSPTGLARSPNVLGGPGKPGGTPQPQPKPQLTPAGQPPTQSPQGILAKQPQPGTQPIYPQGQGPVTSQVPTRSPVMPSVQTPQPHLPTQQGQLPPTGFPITPGMKLSALQLHKLLQKQAEITSTTQQPMQSLDQLNERMDSLRDIADSIEQRVSCIPSQANPCHNPQPDNPLPGIKQSEASRLAWNGSVDSELASNTKLAAGKSQEARAELAGTAYTPQVPQSLKTAHSATTVREGVTKPLFRSPGSVNSVSHPVQGDCVNVYTIEKTAVNPKAMWTGAKGLMSGARQFINKNPIKTLGGLAGGGAAANAVKEYHGRTAGSAPGARYGAPVGPNIGGQDLGGQYQATPMISGMQGDIATHIGNSPQQAISHANSGYPSTVDSGDWAGLYGTSDMYDSYNLTSPEGKTKNVPNPSFNKALQAKLLALPRSASSGNRRHTQRTTNSMSMFPMKVGPSKAPPQMSMLPQLAANSGASSYPLTYSQSWPDQRARQFRDLAAVGLDPRNVPEAKEELRLITGEHSSDRDPPINDEAYWNAVGLPQYEQWQKAQMEKQQHATKLDAGSIDTHKPKWKMAPDAKGGEVDLTDVSRTTKTDSEHAPGGKSRFLFKGSGLLKRAASQNPVAHYQQQLGPQFDVLNVREPAWQPAPLTNKALKQTLRTMFGNRFAPSRDTDFMKDLGGDELDYIELQMELEDRLNKNMTDDDFYKGDTTQKRRWYMPWKKDTVEIPVSNLGKIDDIINQIAKSNRYPPGMMVRNKQALDMLDQEGVADQQDFQQGSAPTANMAPGSMPTSEVLPQNTEPDLNYPQQVPQGSQYMGADSGMVAGVYGPDMQPQRNMSAQFPGGGGSMYEYPFTVGQDHEQSMQVPQYAAAQDDAARRYSGGQQPPQTMSIEQMQALLAGKAPDPTDPFAPGAPEQQLAKAGPQIPLGAGGPSWFRNKTPMQQPSPQRYSPETQHALYSPPSQPQQGQEMGDLYAGPQQQAGPVPQQPPPPQPNIGMMAGGPKMMKAEQPQAGQWHTSPSMDEAWGIKRESPYQPSPRELGMYSPPPTPKAPPRSPGGQTTVQGLTPNPRGLADLGPQQASPQQMRNPMGPIQPTSSGPPPQQTQGLDPMLQRRIAGWERKRQSLLQRGQTAGQHGMPGYSNMRQDQARQLSDRINQARTTGQDYYMRSEAASRARMTPPSQQPKPPLTPMPQQGMPKPPSPQFAQPKPPLPQMKMSSEDFAGPMVSDTGLGGAGSTAQPMISTKPKAASPLTMAASKMLTPATMWQGAGSLFNKAQSALKPAPAVSQPQFKMGEFAEGFVRGCIDRGMTHEQIVKSAAAVAESLPALAPEMHVITKLSFSPAGLGKYIPGAKAISGAGKMFSGAMDETRQAFKGLKGFMGRRGGGGVPPTAVPQTPSGIPGGKWDWTAAGQMGGRALAGEVMGQGTDSLAQEAYGVDPKARYWMPVLGGATRIPQVAQAAKNPGMRGGLARLLHGVGGGEHGAPGTLASGVRRMGMAPAGIQAGRAAGGPVLDLAARDMAARHGTTPEKLFESVNQVGNMASDFKDTKQNITNQIDRIQSAWNNGQGMNKLLDSARAGWHGLTPAQQNWMIGAGLLGGAGAGAYAMGHQGLGLGLGAGALGAGAYGLLGQPGSGYDAFHDTMRGIPEDQRGRFTHGVVTDPLFEQLQQERADMTPGEQYELMARIMAQQSQGNEVQRAAGQHLMPQTQTVTQPVQP